MLEKEFNHYLSNLGVMLFKLHNIHWNVEGTQFMAVHQFTESLYDKVFEYFDAVAEHIKMYNASPLVKASEYASNASIQEIDSQKFTVKQALDILEKDLATLNKEASELRNACDKEGWFTAVSLFEDHVAYYTKQLWFIRASLS